MREMKIIKSGHAGLYPSDSFNFVMLGQELRLGRFAKLENGKQNVHETDNNRF